MQRITSLFLAAMLAIAGSAFPKVAAQPSNDVVGQALVIRRSKTKASLPTAVVLQSGRAKSIREKFIGETNARWKETEGRFEKVETGEDVVLVEAQGLTNDQLALALKRDPDVVVSEPVQRMYSEKLEHNPKVQSDEPSPLSPWYADSETRRLIGADVAEPIIHSQRPVSMFYTSTEKLSMHRPTSGSWGHNFMNSGDPDNVTIPVSATTSHATGVASQLSLALSGDSDFEFFFDVVIDAETGGTTAALVEALSVANQKKAISETNSVAYVLALGGFESLIVRNLLADAEQLNILVAVSSGNQGSNLDTNPAINPLGSYGRYVSGQISVAATQRNIELASSSNFGLRTVELAAPGVTNDALGIGDVPGTFSGTSAAAPLVAAAGAALIGKFGLTAFSARHHLTSTGKHLTPLDGSVKGGRFLDMGAAFSGTISQVVGSELSFEGKAKYFAQKNPPFLQVVAVTDQPEIWFREFAGFATPTNNGNYTMNIVGGAEPGKVHGQSKETIAPVTVKLRVKG